MATLPTVGARMSDAEFEALPYEEGLKWELLDGELIPHGELAEGESGNVSSATALHQALIFRLMVLLNTYLGSTGAGRVFSDVEFALTSGSHLRPDVFILLNERLKQVDLSRVPLSGAPDLAVEVISPSERTSTSHRKVITYLQNDVTEVWQIHPDLQNILIHRSGSARSLENNDTLTTDLLPGFSLRLTDLFAEADTSATVNP